MMEVVPPPPPPQHPISSLPTEMIAKIFEHLSLSDKLKCRDVCKYWKSIIDGHVKNYDSDLILRLEEVQQIEDIKRVTDTILFMPNLINLYIKSMLKNDKRIASVFYIFKRKKIIVLNRELEDFLHTILNNGVTDLQSVKIDAYISSGIMHAICQTQRRLECLNVKVMMSRPPLSYRDDFFKTLPDTVQELSLTGFSCFSLALEPKLNIVKLYLKDFFFQQQGDLTRLLLSVPNIKILWLEYFDLKLDQECLQMCWNLETLILWCLKNVNCHYLMSGLQTNGFTLKSITVNLCRFGARRDNLMWLESIAEHCHKLCKLCIVFDDFCRHRRQCDIFTILAKNAVTLEAVTFGGFEFYDALQQQPEHAVAADGDLMRRRPEEEEAIFPYLPVLRILDIGKCSMTQDVFKKIIEMTPALTHLAVPSIPPYISQLYLERAIRSFRHLTTLSAPSLTVTSKDMIDALNNIERLCIFGYSKSVTLEMFVKNNTSLMSLHLSGPFKSDDDLNRYVHDLKVTDQIFGATPLCHRRCHLTVNIECIQDAAATQIQQYLTSKSVIVSNKYFSLYPDRRSMFIV